MKDLLQLAYDLCEVASPTYEEYFVLQFLEHWLLKNGMHVRRLELEGQPERYNLLAFKRDLQQWPVIFCTHIDTVRPHIAPSIEAESTLWGRGSCDAKGIAAAMLMAIKAQQDLGHEDLAVLFTVGEEDASDGARKANELLKGRARYVVIGEPTEIKAAYAQKGAVVFDLHAEGKAAHSALPHLGDSAIHRLICTMNDLINYPWPTHEIFGDTFLNLGLIKGGQARNTLASEASAQGIMRTSLPASQLSPILESGLSRGVSLTLKSFCDPFEYFVPAGFETMLASFGSDAPYLRDVGQPIMLGPGSLSFAHQENEHITLDELHRGSLAYQAIASQIR